MEIVELQQVVSLACKLSRMGLQAAGLRDENADAVKSTLQAKEKEKSTETTYQQVVAEATSLPK